MVDSSFLFYPDRFSIFSTGGIQDVCSSKQIISRHMKIIGYPAKHR